MKFGFIQKYESGFVPDKWGILGLDPNSNFFKYLMANNKNTFHLLINNTIKKIMDENFEIDSQLVLNPDLKDGKKIYSKKYNSIDEW